MTASQFLYRCEIRESKALLSSDARLYVQTMTLKNGRSMNGKPTQAMQEESNIFGDIDFWTTCSANSIVLDKEQMERLTRYHDELKYWNARVNMVSRKDESHLWDRHILHSLVILKYVNIPKKARVLDIGTGGGLPGIPIKIARPDVRMLLVDSIRKKISMTQMFAEHTGLKDVEARCARVEDLVTETHYRAAFDVIISRAVARTAALLSWSSPLLAPTGIYAFLKGGDLTEELDEAREMFPDAKITVHNVKLFGAPWFEADEKKVVTVTL